MPPITRTGGCRRAGSSSRHPSPPPASGPPRPPWRAGWPVSGPAAAPGAGRGPRGPRSSRAASRGRRSCAAPRASRPRGRRSRGAARRRCGRPAVGVEAHRVRPGGARGGRLGRRHGLEILRRQRTGGDAPLLRPALDRRQRLGPGERHGGVGAAVAPRIVTGRRLAEGLVARPGRASLGLGPAVARPPAAGDRAGGNQRCFQALAVEDAAGAGIHDQLHPVAPRAVGLDPVGLAVEARMGHAGEAGPAEAEDHARGGRIASVSSSTVKP